MPGKLVEAHASFEDDCDSCHVDLEKDKQTVLCLNCHDHSDIASDIKGKVGFHGMSKEVESSPCKHCHTDHKGRDARIVILDQDAFDHRNTDFPLHGTHRLTACASCHTEKKYSNTPGQCIDCHKEQDIHNGNMGEKCDSCHNENRWSDKKFDHDKDTKYPLKGKHTEVACELCHIGKKYKDIPQQCVSCHQINDVHNGNNGKKCESCHEEEEWGKIAFDHKRDAKYALEGAHGELKCLSCHKGDLYKDKLEKTCISCHKKDDFHNGKNGEDCKSCHLADTWRETTFNHDKETKFPLRGGHKELVCESCHKAPAKQVQLKHDCVACHLAEDVHQGQQGEVCSNCHNESGWGEEVFFQHDITKFPLIGHHAALACEECHLSGQFQNAETDCNTCHQPDDVHEEKLGKACQSCHNPNGWEWWIFNHDEQTEYALTGKHTGLDCLACHRKPMDEEKKMSQTCYSCHRKDDEHRGRFGKDCAHCHNTESFREIRYGN